MELQHKLLHEKHDDLDACKISKENTVFGKKEEKKQQDVAIQVDLVCVT